MVALPKVSARIGIPSHIQAKRISALAVSIALSPTLLFWVLALISITQTPWPSVGLRRTWLHTVIWVNFVISAMYAIFLVIRGVTLDADLHHPSVKRSRLLFIGPVALLYLAEAIWLNILDSPQPATNIFLVIACVLLTFSIVSYFWKISHHMEGITTFSLGLIALFGWVATWSLLFIPVVAWSRLRLNRHTPRQIFGGVVLAFLITTFILW